ncbi:YjbH domain-containing protein [Cognatishimia sp. WU-CL00825]|uniref:YjbH domain-containing protein n=1 Tax=Cognatishimia sp. WU-CL00825 TaxID=3127658 RepID=UPI0031053156
MKYLSRLKQIGKAANRDVLAVLLLSSLPSIGLAETPNNTPKFEYPKTPTLGFYGTPGLMDMPSAEMLPDGQFVLGYSQFGGNQRLSLSFQPVPWATATFRYNGIEDLNLFGFSTYYDRSFDVRFRLLKERKVLPAVTLGLQDFAGTGIYAGEYLVATKTFDTPALQDGKPKGQLKVTAGLGWGRLGSYGSIANLGTRPAYNPSSTGGTLSVDQWFRGNVAPFAGVEWQLDDRWGVKAEYSSDAYVTETQTSNVFQRKSPLSFGLEYQARPGLRFGAYYLYGSEIGISAQLQMRPNHPTQQLRIPAPVPIAPRSQWATSPAHYSQDWANNDAKRLKIRDVFADVLAQDGLVLESIVLEGTSAEVRYRNNKYQSYALTNGRVARAMARGLPPSVETFRIVPVRRGIALSAFVVQRADLEAYEFAPNAADVIANKARIEAAGSPNKDAIVSNNLYPAFGTSFSPYTAPSYFDPSQPFRIDVGVELDAILEPAPGWKVAGTLRHRLAGNVKDGRASNSLLPHVRTDQNEYAQFGTTLENLYVSKRWNAGNNIYGRATVGYLESMYGGVSGELLWKPVDSRLALGVEANYVQQRDFNQRLGFRDYKILTGHASAYYEMDNGFLVQVDAGRYLAGDVGATLSVDRVFKNGWSVGGFVSKTNVSAAQFGEGSFDKGIRFNIPLAWNLGKPSRNGSSMVIRPTQRDGAQRLSVPDRLYSDIREAHQKSLIEQRARFWE